MNLGKLCGGWRTAILATGLLGLATGRPLAAAGDTPATPPADTAGAQSVTLEYRELGGKITDLPLFLSSRKELYAKEPALGGRKARRGVIQFGGDPSQNVSFLWDYTKGILYLDLNRNQDLTDDPAGVVSCPSFNYSPTYQTFTNLHLAFKTATGTRPLAGDLSLYCFFGAGDMGGSFACRSIWDGKLSLQGREWQIGFVEGMSRDVSESRTLILRPWASRKQPLDLSGGSLDGFPFRTNLFLNQQAYRLGYTSMAQGSNAQYHLTIQEQTTPLGTLRLNGRFIDRLVLLQEPAKGGFVTVLNNPAPVAKVPVGTYGPAKVCLKAGEVAAYRATANSPPGQRGAVVSATSEAVLEAGGPLTNSIEVKRDGGMLSLSYHLVGADGRPYQLANQDRGKPPEFVVTQNGKPVFSGKFEFG